MELRHLRYFIAVADRLSFTRAAATLRLTQPALSRQIRDLEAEVGVPLLYRQAHGIELTSAGTAFLPRAREIIAAADRAIGEARTAGRQIRFGHYGTLWLDYFAPALRLFAKRHPERPLHPTELAPAELAQALRQRTLDFALLGPAPAGADDDELVIRRVATTPATVVLSASNPLGKRRRITLAELRDAAWVRWDERQLPGRNQLLVDAAREVGFTPRWGPTADSIGSVFMQVAQSAAVGLVLPMSRRTALPGLVFTELKGSPVLFPMDVAWRADHPDAAILVRLASMLEESRG